MTTHHAMFDESGNIDKDHLVFVGWGFRRSWTLIPKGSRTAFRDDPEHHRSVATLATRLCGKVFGFVKRNPSGAKRRPDAASGQRGVGKGGRPCPTSAHSDPGAL